MEVKDESGRPQIDGIKAREMMTRASSTFSGRCAFLWSRNDNVGRIKVVIKRERYSLLRRYVGKAQEIVADAP